MESIEGWFGPSLGGQEALHSLHFHCSSEKRGHGGILFWTWIRVCIVMHSPYVAINGVCLSSWEYKLFEVKESGLPICYQLYLNIQNSVVVFVDYYSRLAWLWEDYHWRITLQSTHRKNLLRVSSSGQKAKISELLQAMKLPTRRGKSETQSVGWCPWDHDFNAHLVLS